MVPRPGGETSGCHSSRRTAGRVRPLGTNPISHPSAATLDRAATTCVERPPVTAHYGVGCGRPRQGATGKRDGCEGPPAISTRPCHTSSDTGFPLTWNRPADLVAGWVEQCGFRLTETLKAQGVGSDSQPVSSVAGATQAAWLTTRPSSTRPGRRGMCRPREAEEGSRRRASARGGAPPVVRSPPAREGSIAR